MKKLGKSKSIPGLCFVGPLAGRLPGRVTTQALILSELFSRDGYRVFAASAHPNRCLRMADIASTIVRRASDYDVLIIDVFSGRSFAVADIASWLGLRLGKPIIMTLRGGALPQFADKYPRWVTRVLRRADLIVSPSDYNARTVSHRGLKAEVIQNVINLSSYTYRHRSTLSPNMFWMRSFHPVWNPLMAVRTLSRLVVDVPDAALVMAGQDKGLEQEARALSENLNLGQRVRFAGFLDKDGKSREGSRADIYLNTNHLDNMPVAVVEACAMGLPIVSTAVGGIPDLLEHGDTGLLVPDNDDAAMARSVLNLLNNPDLAARLSANGRRLAESSSWENVRPLWELAFERVLARRTARTARINTSNIPAAHHPNAAHYRTALEPLSIERDALTSRRKS